MRHRQTSFDINHHPSASDPLLAKGHTEGRIRSPPPVGRPLCDPSCLRPPSFRPVAGLAAAPSAGLARK